MHGNLGIAGRNDEEFLRSGERSPPRQGPARSTKSQAGARERLTMHGTSIYAFKRRPLIGRLLVEGPPVPKAEPQSVPERPQYQKGGAVPQGVNCGTLHHTISRPCCRGA
jgi:hypothetical protein